MAYLRTYIEERLGSPIPQWIQEVGLEQASYRTLAEEIRKTTGIRVGKSALQKWLVEEL